MIKKSEVFSEILFLVPLFTPIKLEVPEGNEKEIVTSEPFVIQRSVFQTKQKKSDTNSQFLTYRPSLPLKTSNLALSDIIKIASNQCISQNN